MSTTPGGRGPDAGPNRETLVEEISRLFAAVPATQATGMGGIRQAIIEDVANAARSTQALGPAMAANPASASPQLARSLQAGENAWRRVEAEFGLLSSAEVAELLGGKPSNRNFASSKRAAGKIMGVLRGNSYRFPGFQFDTGRAAVLPVIEPLIRLGRAHSWSEEDLILWLTVPSSFFAAADRPVDHVDEPAEVLAAAKDEFETP